MSSQYQSKAVNVLKQLNKKLNTRVKTERKRPVSHYTFYQTVTNPLTGKHSKELSPLANPSSYPENIGLLGYFQINANKTLSSPLLPHQTRKQLAQADTNLKWQEIERRISIKENIRVILQQNDFVINDDADTNIKLVKNDENTGKLKLESFQVKITNNNEFIIFRNYWLGQQHKIQGFIVEKNAYLHAMLSDFFVQGHFESEVLLRLKVIHSDLGIQQYYKYTMDKEGNANIKLLNEENPELQKTYIYHGYVIAPFQKLQLKFTNGSYPLSSASGFVMFFFILLVVVIFLGCLGFYWLGIKQIALAEQRMNFVSSVSHELRTPLTSISMYSEMLKSGMVVDPDTQREYHEFIFGESGRLSRLISNILKLSKLNQQQDVANLEYVSVFSLQDTIQSKVSSLIEKNNFTINFFIDENIDKLNNDKSAVLVDLDAFSQIVINLVDNSVKFYNAAKIEDIQRRKIDISFSLERKSAKRIKFSVRDYGTGISKTEHDKVFELFYREGNEMTRSTPGTGIGLALVNELVVTQGGSIKIKRVEPGVQFDITFDYKNS